MLRSQLFKSIALQARKRRKNIRIFLIGLTAIFLFNAFQNQANYKIAKLKYNGGGDWYANRTALPNLLRFFNQTFNTRLVEQEGTVEVGSTEIFNYPFVYLTGHGNVIFNAQEAENLRNYLLAGGFLHIDDNYGLDKFIRREMKKVFPDLEFQELPVSHSIYHQKFDFPKGLPKIHEHDNKRPQGFGLIHKGRLICFYSYESDLGNGWEDVGTYSDPKEKHVQALRMGVNLLQYVFEQ